MANPTSRKRHTSLSSVLWHLTSKFGAFLWLVMLVVRLVGILLTTRAHGGLQSSVLREYTERVHLQKPKPWITMVHEQVLAEHNSTNTHRGIPSNEQDELKAPRAMTVAGPPSRSKSCQQGDEALNIQHRSNKFPRVTRHAPLREAAHPSKRPVVFVKALTNLIQNAEDIRHGLENRPLRLRSALSKFEDG